MLARLTLVVFVLLAALPGLAQAPPAPAIDPAKEADIRHLMDVTGARNMGTQMGKQMADSLRPLLEKSLPPFERKQQFVDRFFEKLLARLDSPELANRLIPIYDRHLSREDIQAFIQFFESLTGQRFIAVMPQIIDEANSAGQQWADEMLPAVMQEMEEEFPEVKNPHP